MNHFGIKWGKNGLFQTLITAGLVQPLRNHIWSAMKNSAFKKILKNRSASQNHRADVYTHYTTTECFNNLFKECKLDFLAYGFFFYQYKSA